MRLTVKYEMSNRFGSWRHEWSAVGARGAISVWITEARSDSDSEAYGGVEVHYRTPPDYMIEDAPSQIKCHLLGGPCWHDGSSLAADSWIEMWRGGDGCNNKKMISMVESEYKQRFNIEQEQDR